MPFLADCSLSLINQTGAHFVAREIVEGLPQHFAAVRRWRLFGEKLPAGLIRKICGRVMLRELRILGASRLWQWPQPGAPMPTLYMDPLYVLRAPLKSTDIVLCHDVGPVSHPELYDPGTTAMYREAFEKIRGIGPGMVFVSVASKEAFIALFGRAYRFLTAIPLFVRALGRKVQEQPVEGISEPFLLSVAAFERRKNLPLAIAAFARSGVSERGVSFVLCGAQGLDWSEVYDAAACVPNVKVLGYVSEGELHWLYKHASGFVLPSLLEGFGMPALEAASYGLIPVISAGGALEEAVQGLGIAVDPLSVDDVARGMTEVMGLSAGARAERATALIAHARAASREHFIESWDSLLKGDRAVAAA